MENDKNIIINPQYVYLTIPAEYVCLYHRLLIYMSDFGRKIIDDCNTICNDKDKNIINCWNLFQSAIACKELGKNKEAEFFINYIELQLKHIYHINATDEYTSVFPVTIDKNGFLKAQVTCGNDVIFTVDEHTGELYINYINDKDDKKYNIIDNNLIVKGFVNNSK